MSRNVITPSLKYIHDLYAREDALLSSIVTELERRNIGWLFDYMDGAGIA